MVRAFAVPSLPARHYPARVRTAVGALLLILAGCLPEPGEPAQEAPRPLARTGNAWSDCYRRFQPTGDPASDIAVLGSACAAPAGMAPITPLHAGAAQGPDDPPAHFTFHARRGRCYRAFAVGAPGVEDLDVAVYDPRGQLVAGDVSRDRWPVVPPRGPACAGDDGALSVHVAVTRGHGPWMVQVWATGGEHE